MPPAVAAAAITGGASIAGGVIGSRAQSGASRRAHAAQTAAAERAEAFEREQDARNRADQERRDAEDQRRWNVDQQNTARQQAERDARQQYEDGLRYRKMVNLARLTGMPMPDPMPSMGGASPGAPVMAQPRREASSAMQSRPSTANQMIQQPEFDPFQAPGAQRMPISRLSGRRY